MKRVLAGGAAGALLVGFLGIWSGMLSLSFPWSPDLDFTEIEVAMSMPEAATIVAVEPITLDCRARVHAAVPIKGRREHTLFGKVYRTDTVEMNAIGDVDTCIDGSAATITYNRDGTTNVEINGADIVFVRPRVNAVETADSVHVNKGLVGKWSDVFPWVDDDLGLTPLAYAWAQNVIGGSECMQAAYTVTEQMILDAYTEQFIASGADPERLSVEIIGGPVFQDPPPLELGDVEMTIDYDTVTCSVADELQTEPSVRITN